MEQNFKTFVACVEHMRDLQKNYFKTRQQDDLYQSKAAEKRVDELIKDFKKPAELFGQ